MGGNNLCGMGVGAAVQDEVTVSKGVQMRARNSRVFRGGAIDKVGLAASLLPPLSSLPNGRSHCTSKQCSHSMRTTGQVCEARLEKGSWPARALTPGQDIAL